MRWLGGTSRFGSGLTTISQHNDWVSDRWLASLINGKQRYKTFWKKVEEENGRALKWGLQTMPWPKPEAEAVPNQWKHIDRILDVQITTDIPKKKKGPVKEEADVRVERALIKFQDQPWNESYWEKFPAEGEPDFAEFQMALKAFQRRETLAPPKIVTKSRRRFEELSAQPETLKGGDLKDYQLEGLNWLLFNHSELRSCILADGT
jgi:SNF2 family DNA or RNA helicase